jgi:hypothetical protein
MKIWTYQDEVEVKQGGRGARTDLHVPLPPLKAHDRCSRDSGKTRESREADLE